MGPNIVFGLASGVVKKTQLFGDCGKSPTIALVQDFINTLTSYIAPLTYPLSPNGGKGQVEGEVIFTE